MSANADEDNEVVIPATGPGSFYCIGEPRLQPPVIGDGDIIIHVVKVGDSLFKICKEYNLDYYLCKNAIMLLNGFTHTWQLNELAVGQELKLPATNAFASTLAATIW